MSLETKSQKKFYNNEFKTIVSPQTEERIRDFYFRKFISILENNDFKIDKYSSIIDIGCGNGVFMEKMKGYFPESNIEGCDISEKNIEICKNIGLKVHVIKAEDFFYTKKFNLVYGNAILHHLNNIESFFENITKYVDTNGAILFGPEPTKYQFLYFIWHKLRGTWGLEMGQLQISRSGIEKYLSKNFKNIKIYCHGNCFVYSSNILGKAWNRLGFSKIPCINDIYIYAEKK